MSIEVKMKKRIENRWTTAEESIETAKVEADETNITAIFTAKCKKNRTKAEVRRKNKSIIWKTEHIKTTDARETSSM